MKILHIANFGFNKQGTHFYSTDRKISAGLIENGHLVYDFSFRDMARMGTIFKTKKLGANWAGKEVLKIVDNLEPDLIVLGHLDLMKLSVLQEIKAKYPNIKMLAWYVDWLEEQHKVEYVSSVAQYVDAVFVTTAGATLKHLKERQQHTTFAYMPNMSSRSVECLKQFEIEQYQRDLLFCGTVYKDPLREQFLLDLKQQLAQNKIKFDIFGAFGVSAVYGKDYYRILTGTQMGLNLSRKNDITLYSSDRIVHLTGNGLLTFSPRIPKFELLYSENELVYFDHQADLAEKIHYYHQNREQANTIAQAGWQKTHQSFNAKRITQFMLETTFNLPYSQQYEWLDEVY